MRLRSAGSDALPAHPGLPPIYPSRPPAALRGNLPGSASGSPMASGMPAKSAAGYFGSMHKVRPLQAHTCHQDRAINVLQQHSCYFSSAACGERLCCISSLPGSVGCFPMAVCKPMRPLRNTLAPCTKCSACLGESASCSFPQTFRSGGPF